VIDGMNEWQNRPLHLVYPVLFIDCVHVKLRDGQVENRPIYVVLAVTDEGTREILGLGPATPGSPLVSWAHSVSAAAWAATCSSARRAVSPSSAAGPSDRLALVQATQGQQRG
jgi:hypothetical protein